MADRKIYRRRRYAASGILAVLLFGAYATSAMLHPLPAALAHILPLNSVNQEAATPLWPGYGSGALSAVDFSGILSEHGSQRSVPMASITKLVTALVVLDAHPLSSEEQGPDIVLTDADERFYREAVAQNNSFAPARSGATLTERQALTAMLLPSANNYAQTLAIWAYGSVNAYLVAASEWLASHQLTQTTVVDVGGLSPQSSSSPADIVAVGKLVLAHPVLAGIVAMPSVDLPVTGKLVNTNKLLGTAGVTGIKTGTTDEAGSCLLFSAVISVSNRPVTLVGVLLGGENHPTVDADVRALIDSVTPEFRLVQAVEKGKQYANYHTAWGQEIAAVSENDIFVLVWSDTPVHVSVQTHFLEETSKMGSVGTLIVEVNGVEQHGALRLNESVHDPGFWWRITHPAELWG